MFIIKFYGKNKHIIYGYFVKLYENIFFKKRFERKWHFYDIYSGELKIKFNICKICTICTGEKTIGFYSAADKKLHYAELVRSNSDIEALYRKYGIEIERRIIQQNKFDNLILI
jgi:hypothetical protein